MTATVPFDEPRSSIQNPPLSSTPNSACVLESCIATSVRGRRSATRSPGCGSGSRPTSPETGTSIVVPSSKRSVTARRAPSEESAELAAGTSGAIGGAAGAVLAAGGRESRSSGGLQDAEPGAPETTPELDRSAGTKPRDDAALPREGSGARF
ncbi:hypothetical protein GCM10009792_04580 [Microcella alkalica]|uniref:Uncharacterized protein n=1 Tax=Microcella alkalica TaxID=355930 RepID=A0A839EAM9_9MICO|nr:hypothetical protein [Microcella alkalica]MBA8848780.1 hypothetical protein [Microcella alkalica]